MLPLFWHLLFTAFFGYFTYWVARDVLHPPRHLQGAAKTLYSRAIRPVGAVLTFFTALSTLAHGAIVVQMLLT